MTPGAGGLLVPVVLAAFVLLGALERRWRRRRRDATDRLQPESRYFVRVSETGLCVRVPDGNERSVDLAALERVSIRTLPVGPWLPDVWWEFHGDDGGVCRVPQGATGAEALLALAERLPGFDFARFTEAMGHTDDAVFVCWTRPARHPDEA